MLTALMAAAKRGVTVRMITDWFGTGHGCWQPDAGQLHSGWCRAPYFQSVVPAGRDAHAPQKICVVDRSIAFVGGININDDMFCDYDHNVSLSAPRWDFAVAVRGPLVASIHKEAARSGRGWGKCPSPSVSACSAICARQDKVTREAAMQAGFVVRDNLRNRITIQRAYLKALGRARKERADRQSLFASRKFRRTRVANARSAAVEVVLLIGVGEHWMQDAVAHSFLGCLLSGRQGGGISPTSCTPRSP